MAQDPKKTTSTKQAPLTKVVLAVAVWWLANTVATIASKSVMRGGDSRTSTSTGLTTSFRDMRWVELTLLQHLVGGVLAGAWVKVTGKSLWPVHAREHFLLVVVAATGNVVGNSATNAAFSLITSSTAQVIKACEPLFTFALTLLLYRNYSNLDISTLLSVVIIVMGAGSFLMKDASFNVWGLMAAMVSNMAFPTRNIFLKKLSDIWDSPLQKFAVMSIISTLLALPVWMVKVLFVSGFSTNRITESLVSSFFHSTYNLASITVLESVTPVTHAILNISKRLFVIMANILYFSTPFTLTMFVSLVVLLVGCYLYQLKNSSGTKWIVMKCVFVALFLAFFLLPIPGSLKTSTGASSTTATPTLSVVQTSLIQTPALGVEKTSSMDTRTLSMVKTSSVEGCPRHISTSWIYNRPIPSNIVDNIAALSRDHPNTPLYVYCGTTQCVSEVARLESTQIRAEFARVKEILRDTPLEQWLAYHSFYKVLARTKYETNLQDAVRVGLLLKYGGLYVSPTIKITNITTFCQTQDAQVLGTDTRNPLDVAYFSRGHPFLVRLAEEFAKQYPSKGSDKTPFKFDFKDLLTRLLDNSACTDCPKRVTSGLQLSDVTPGKTDIPANHFGTLSFQTRVRGVRVANLGDEVQDFPGLQYLPFIDHFAERDSLMSARSNDHTLVFFNAWWGSGGSSWPAPSNIEPIMLSVHLHGGKLSSRITSHMDFVKKREPIGCRDPSTLSVLRKSDVKAYFSGCMTVLTDNPVISGKRNDKIYIVDVKDNYVKLLPPEVQEKAIRIGNNLRGSESLDSLNRFTEAYKRVKMSAEAKLVITSRIHAGIPAVGMGTPVIFFNGAGMPGGGGSKTSGSSRITGLTELFHTVDFYKMTKEEAVKFLTDFNWENPPPNPNFDLTMRLRASFWDMIRKYQPLHDAAKKFGTIPMTPPPASLGITKHLFHVVLTSELGEGEQLNWRQWRSVESILRHHPTSEVVVHSNTIPPDTFEVLSESGYLISIQGYDLGEWLRSSPAGDFATKLERARSGENWSTREASLVGLLSLYEQGGVLVDLDTILTRPLDSLPSNSVAWASAANSSISNKLATFGKKNTFVRLSLAGFSRHFDTSGTDQQNLFTEVWKKNSATLELNILGHQTVYELSSRDTVHQCLENTSGTEAVEDRAYLVSLNSDLWSETESNMITMKDGTLCHHLLTAFCVLCNNLH